MATAQPTTRPTAAPRTTAPARPAAPAPAAPPSVPAPGGPTSAPTLIGSVQRALRLLEAVSDHPGGAPAKQLAREAGLPLPTAYHLLRTLTHEGYLHREQGVFVLGSAAGRLGRGGAGQARRSTITEAMERWRDTLGAAVYFAVYRDGEVELTALAESIEHPAVEEWADLRETAHAHAIGQCLLSQLDTRTRQDHLDRHPVEALTTYTVRDGSSLLERLAAIERMETVFERQEYALGTVCAAIPVTIGQTATVLAISLPLDQEYRLEATIERLRGEIAEVARSLMFSISI
ncbi:helix-turn-helix domain-containing protein [Streptomyces sp. NBC_00237]|uniref:IclR family transcriptional regulator n=1 Tax=Streptomyces sp. NBC_00237 TaxID=2975687 RepID=UPI00225AA0A6|nr:IclR family transcriptional regulator C-terminal domain-containing protein [Streptomyces sp. NBC_00237]MCX5200014.1 helix-turn-helix domain-containing protein [Streptomyces sp. NBC_00237]